MYLTPQSLAANGSSAWMILNAFLIGPGANLELSFSEDASLTANAQLTLDDPTQNQRSATWTRAGTLATITDNLHGLKTGDNILAWVDATGTLAPAPVNQQPGVAAPPSSMAPVSYDVTVTGTNTYTINVANAGALAGSLSLQSFRVQNVTGLNAITGTPPARTLAPLAQPAGAVRLNVTGWVAGFATLLANTGKGY